MSSKFIFAIVVVVASIGMLMYSATTSSAKSVVTVAELVTLDSVPERGVQLGARVLEGTTIAVSSVPHKEVRFTVRDIEDTGARIDIVYKGAMPDTLKAGRDVIVQGTLQSGVFHANQLLTQCPSKYEPPKPGESNREVKAIQAYTS